MQTIAEGVGVLNHKLPRGGKGQDMTLIETEERIYPTLYVKHPDGSYTEAAPRDIPNESAGMHLRINEVARRMELGIASAAPHFTWDIQQWLKVLRGEMQPNQMHPMPPDIDKGRKQA